MEQRRHPRIRVGGMCIDVADGFGCCSVAAGDVSRGGLCLTEIAKRFGQKIDKYTVVASSGEQHFKFQVKPRWEQVGRWNKKIGVEIENVPWQWMAYVMSLEERRSA